MGLFNSKDPLNQAVREALNDRFFEVIRASNKIEPYKIESSYKFYVGKGNNSGII